ncbi:MAG: DUF6065 family protein [Acidobacteria bacterium]|nr:DUF6065 family protein [Acidobacteriota bacterium]
MTNDSHVPIQAAGDDSPRRSIKAHRIDLAEMFGRAPAKAIYPRIVPASPDRFWMDFTTQGWANRCLPLRIANQTGWFIMNEEEFEVEWNGKPQVDGLRLKSKDGGPLTYVSSMFGFGILTWTIPYLFQTAPGFNLLARGPANYFKDAVVPLDGVIETDWLPYPFTMNWKITRPGQKIKFDREDPMCMLIPIRRGDVESFAPEIRNLPSAPDLQTNYSAWHRRRREAARAIQTASAEEAARLMQGNYIRGETELGARATEHQNKLDVRPFASMEEPLIPLRHETPAEPKPATSEKGLLNRMFGR